MSPQSSSSSRRRTWWTLTAVVAVALLIAIGVFIRLDPRLWTTPEGTAEAVARSFEDDTVGAAPWVDAEAVDGEYAAVTGPLRSVGMDAPAVVTVTGVSEADGGRAEATLEWKWYSPRNEGASAPDWTYESTLPLVKQDLKWQAEFAQAVVHPSLQDAVFAVDPVVAARGEIRARDNRVIVADATVVDVGIEPGRIEDLDETVDEVASHLDVDAAELRTRIEAARPTHFVPVITLREPDYRAVAEDIRPIPGTVFRERTQALAFDREFARSLIGTVGEATAEDIENGGGAVLAGDVVGRSGLQKAFEADLRGEDGFALRTVPESGEPEEDAEPLLQIDASAGPALRTTLDIDIQRAADAAVDAAPKPASLVAIDHTTGEIVAVADGGAGDDGYNRALLGTYAPGSVFKAASTLALLRSGLAPEDSVPCPETTTVEGKEFRNAEGHAFGDVPFHEDFAESCNTAFVNEADRVSAQEVQEAAQDLGMLDNTIGTDAVAGTVDPHAAGVDFAAMMIGQGTVTASPLGIATMSASIAAGRPVDTVLLPDHVSADDAPASSLRPEEAEVLQDLMREVVTDGTANALADVPGDPVYGKTGTAEYGSEVPPRTHAWFTGWQGDLAFAVLVEDGGFGSETAVPVAEEFLRGIPR
ncbi:penicillin-binding transpeptidase domain-containing protein [Brevibacterium samyangense]|uniref:Penicillin-binding transpeptidase domain-containing protein n=1 Tax=Brevibacterium samyangense TaxID=366888 RepID=A0ABN2TII6_9MICO